MIMQLKESIGSDFITERELSVAKFAVSKLNAMENIELLLPSISKRLPIFSFMVRVPKSDLYLHYNFVSAILNDIFGIQTRGGCVCAGPYAQELLGMRGVSGLPERFEKILVEDSRLDRIHLRRAHESSQYEILRPGFCRFSLPYFFDDEQVEQVLRNGLK
jgi:selenocysteine lyase/cysteine desulfurase